MSVSVDQSYETCRQVAKARARNFYYSFTVLPPPKKAAMCAIYAFMRYCDDLSDDEQCADRSGLLHGWRQALDRALAGDYGDSPILPAFHDAVTRYAIPARFFHELIDGAEMDLTETRYATFDDLYRYCYRVASVVGFVCLHVWGFRGGDATYVPAEACGIAFQLTNILRDLKEDVERGRIYLPESDLGQHGYTEDDLRRGVVDERFRSLMRFECSRARSYYERAAPLAERIEPDSRQAFVVMYRIYRALLEQIEAQGYDVFSRRARLSTPRKVGIVAGAWFHGGVSGLWRRA